MATTEDVTGSLHKIKFTLLSDSTGADSEVTTNKYNGLVHYAVFQPDSGGTAPDAAWDVVVTDGGSIDVLGGLGADLSATAATYKKASDGLGCVKSSALTCTASGMGEANGGTVTLYLIIDN